MNREGAETYLRVLAEAEMRGPVLPAPHASWPGGAAGGTARMAAVAQALTAVSALDAATAADIMADFDLAVSVRQDPAWPGQGPAGGTSSKRSPRLPPGLRFAAGPMLPARWLARSWPQAPPPRPAGPAPAAGAPAGAPGGAAAGGAAAGGASGQERPGRAGTSGPDRFVPVGLTVRFRHDGSDGEVFLMAYARTASGARFILAWRLLNSHQRPPTQPGLFFKLLRITDDRGEEYEPCFASRGGPDWTSQVSLRPEPPDDVRWFDIVAPGSPAVRVRLDQAESGTAGAHVSERTVSAGEHLLTRLAERLLVIAAQFPPDLWPELAASSPGPFDSIVAGLGDVIAALAAAAVLPPLSPVPGQLAALCASLRISGHGITAPPARELPEPWLSLLAHYQRRKPDAAPVRDGLAAVAGALPELDGVRLALIGLHNTDGGTSLQVLAKGLMPEEHHSSFGFDMYFPLSVWIRDSGGRWHAARPSGWHRADDEYALRLQLVPPLPRSTEWIEVRAAGQSAQARTELPLRWGDRL